jgi:hypothetical protein
MTRITLPELDQHYDIAKTIIVAHRCKNGRYPVLPPATLRVIDGIMSNRHFWNPEDGSYRFAAYQLGNAIGLSPRWVIVCLLQLEIVGMGWMEVRQFRNGKWDIVVWHFEKPTPDNSARWFQEAAQIATEVTDTLSTSYQSVPGEGGEVEREYEGEEERETVVAAPPTFQSVALTEDDCRAIQGVVGQVLSLDPASDGLACSSSREIESASRSSAPGPRLFATPQAPQASWYISARRSRGLSAAARCLNPFKRV